MKTINKFFAMATFFLIGGLVAPEIKAQTQTLSAASWIKWYKPNPKDANKNVRVYRVGTAQELSQIATNVKNGKVIGGKIYELPGASSIRFTLTEPNLWYDYWLKSYQDIDKTVTRENMPEVMAKGDVLYWDNNFSGVTVYNYYFSQNSKSVKYVSDYSGLSEKVPVLVHNGKIVGKMDCFNPLLYIKKEEPIVVKEKVKTEVVETEIEVEEEEEECWEYVWKTRTTYTTEYRQVQRYSPRGDYTGLQGFDQGYTTMPVRVPHKTRTRIKVPCGEGFQEEEEIPYTENDQPERTWCERYPLLCAKLMNTRVNVGVHVTKNSNVGGFTPVTPGGQGGFTPVTPGKQGGGTVVTPGGQGGFTPVTPGRRLGE
jgi:hypothetical protein